MAKTYSAGVTTAYGAAKRGGYTGTYEEFCSDLAQLADVLSEFLGFSVTVQTLAEGASATASYDDGVLALGIPRGNTGNGIQSIVLNADYTLTVTYTNGNTWTSGSIRGQVGATPHLTIGTVQTLEPGQSATADITGTDENPVLNLGIPKGQAGASDAGGVSYDPEGSYDEGTVGAELQEQNRQLSDYAETGELRTLLTDSNTLDKNYYWTGTIGNALTRSSYNAESVYIASPIDVSEYDHVLVQLSSPNMGGSRCIGFCNAENIISIVWRENGFVTTYNDKTGMYEKLLATNGQTHFFFSYSRTVATNIKIYGIKTSYYANDGIVYVSPSGSDSNTGTGNSPLKTINKALEKGAKTVLLTGGTYLQTIDLSKSKYASLKMKPLNGSNTVVFKDADCIIGESANSVSGYTNVKSITTQKTLASSNKWIWQEGVNDSKSLISDAWRHPLQRGQEYRRTDTRIMRSSLTTLSDALTDIETSASNSTYKWYYDSGVLYFASPSEVTAEHPICCSNGNRLFNNTPNGFTLNVTGVSSKYLIFDVSNTENTTLTDCKSENVYGAGAFIYNNCISVKFIKCEANSCVTGENGDGFNGHANISNSPFTKQCTALFVDCWAHDNNDDGYSDHERAETTIIGGLFESNNKGGVAPSYGSHLTCYNVIARGNYSGFLCTGTAEQAEGGKYTQMLCYNCLSYQNERGGRKSGFCVDGENNKMTLIGCKSIHNTYGYTAYASSNTAELIDCCASENTASVTNGSGTFDIKNTTAVTM